MFNLQDFRNKFVNGGARPSQFKMQITWPDAIRGIAGVSAAERDFSFLCSVSEIPQSTVGFIPVPFQGRKLYYAGDREFQPLTITVLNDEDFKVRKSLEAWMRGITEHSLTTSQFNGGIASGSYVTDGVVTQLSRNNGGASLKSYKFVGMFPVDLGAIALDWNSTDQIETFTCQFKYQWWDEVTDSSVSVNVNL